MRESYTSNNPINWLRYSTSSTLKINYNLGKELAQVLYVLTKQLFAWRYDITTDFLINNNRIILFIYVNNPKERYVLLGKNNWKKKFLESTLRRWYNIKNIIVKVEYTFCRVNGKKIHLRPHPFNRWNEADILRIEDEVARRLSRDIITGKIKGVRI